MTIIRAWAAPAAGAPLEPYCFESTPLGAEELEVKVEYCGLCHSDISMLENHWGESIYPLIPGHEIIGTITALGVNTKGLAIGQRVGIGWTKSSCMYCASCLKGDQHLCSKAESTIIGHHGGFSEYARAHWAWAVPLPEKLDASAVAPLFCGGLTVFFPLLEFGVRPTDRVGIIGIGGLGHLAIKFVHAWGCEVTAFTSNTAKHPEISALGAHHVVATHDIQAMQAIAGSIDFLLVTTNVPLEWEALMSTLSPTGRMHIVGVVLEPIEMQAIQLISGQKSVSGSPTGSPAVIATMLDFCARHTILPQVEHFPMSRINEAISYLQSGKVRYRIVLDADFT